MKSEQNFILVAMAVDFELVVRQFHPFLAEASRQNWAIFGLPRPANSGRKRRFIGRHFRFLEFIFIAFITTILTLEEKQFARSAGAT